MAMLAKQKKLRGVILPEENAREAAVVDGIEVMVAPAVRPAR
jgi:predicted ATPase with chaperone activity